jgi:nucleoside-diphosphate-sugar epimerase
MKKVLITGGGGFIGGHLALKLKELFQIRSVDSKSFDKWYSFDKDLDNRCLDLNNFDACVEATQDIDYVFHFACNMGGMGFIEHHKTECMMSVIPDSFMLKASKMNNVKKFLFSSSACVYPQSLQNTNKVQQLSEELAYPADSEDGYGWEKLFIERMCRHYKEDHNLDTKVVRFHSIYGPLGTWDGERAKAPAALCRKVIEAKYNQTNKIEIWGDGEQTRSILYIDDCIDGFMKVFNSDINYPINVGSENLYSINEIVSTIEKIAEVNLNRKYILDAPLGVRGRNSDSSKLKNLGWEQNFTLEKGLRFTYEWIEKQFLEKYK